MTIFNLVRGGTLSVVIDDPLSMARPHYIQYRTHIGLPSKVVGALYLPHHGLIGWAPTTTHARMVLSTKMS